MDEYEGYQIEPEMSALQIDPIPEQTYTGYEICPEVVVKVAGQTLTEGDDYEVSYVNNTYPGTATAIVVGTGLYAGTASAQFAITATVAPKVTTRDGVDWSNVYDPDYYAQKNPDVANWAMRRFNSGSVIDDAALLQHFANNGAKEGRKGKDAFELASYYNANADLRRAFGTSDWAKYYRHYCTNGAKENRTAKGVAQLRGAITSRDGVDWAPAYDALYYAQKNPDVGNWATRRFSSGSVIDDDALLRHFVNNGAGERRASKETFDVVSYRNRYADLNAAFGNNWKAYYRHFCTNGFKEGRDGTKNLEVSSDAETPDTLQSESAKISMQDVSVSIEDQVYTGASIEPEPTVTLAERQLVRGTDFEVQYTSNTDVGTATVVLTGMGDFEGTKETTFEILPAQAEALQVEPIENQVYTGDELMPEPVVRSGDTVLEEGADYDVTYADNVNAGTASVTVTGKGDYAGTVTAHFTIERASIVDAEVTITYDNDEASIKGNGTTRLKPHGVAVSVAGVLLTEGVDYQLAYRNSLTSCVVVVTGIGNWRDATCARANVTIADEGSQATASMDGISIAAAEYASVPGKYVTVGSDILTASPVIKYGGKTLVEGVDYDITRYCVDTPGSAALVVRGLGGSDATDSFVGKRRFDFEIVDPATIDLGHDVFFAQVEGLDSTPLVKLGDKILEEGRDYVVVLRGNDIVISGIGSYCGAAIFAV